ncbi:SWIM zinc finger family protein [Cumulibacter manganitolerans]|uniref:SWIM zinc finger family protein n=1 Tax=Cumulibacter manganitolerans TaxID=1884992 RepID=UPI001294C5C0|nr:DUF6880 family protein [Cumulibacter manganitolerans]
MQQLTETVIRLAADDGRFARGEDYVRYVRGLQTSERTASATIQAKRVYVVHLDWTGSRLTGTCTCWDEPDGLCKHQVAVALAVVENAPPDNHGQPAELADFVRRLPADELATLLLDIAGDHEDVHRRLTIRMATATGNPNDAAKELESSASRALSIRGFIDYRRSFEVAAAAATLLRELETTFRAAGSAVVQPALLRTLGRLRSIVQRADDSGGAIGDAEQHAYDLYVRACRQGPVDAKKLARWLVKYQIESPGWPDARLAHFSEALGEPGLATYRAELRKRSASTARRPAHPDRPWQRDHDRDTLDDLLIDLARHDGDVEELLRLLDDPESPRPAEAIRVLFAAGRAADAETRLDGWLGASPKPRDRPMSFGRDRALNAGEIIAMLESFGRHDDALEHARQVFRFSPGADTFAALLDVARPEEREEQRAWALAAATEKCRALGDARPLVLVHLADGDGDAAWTAAHEFGSTQCWPELVSGTSETHPAQCAMALTIATEPLLQVAGSAQYQEIAALLTRARPLYAAAGRTEELREYLRQIRTEHARRPLFISELNRAALDPDTL